MVERKRGWLLTQERKAWFQHSPLCVHCQQKNPPVVRLATELDHIVPLFKGGSDDDSNKQGLCDVCHAVKTALDLGYEYRPKVDIGEDGWPHPRQLNVKSRR